MSERFKVDLRGIIDLAANHLYTSPEVFVREVVQNAVDAVSARAQLPDAPEGPHEGLVRIELTQGAEPSASTISVTDNGIGLTLDEVHSFLSTVGGSSKRPDAEEFVEGLAADAEGDADPTSYLGRFGIGLLSCFMVTDEIVVVTRSARSPDAPAIEWRGRADGSYAVRELASARPAPGTTVYLRCKEGAEEYFEHERLIELARRFAEMLATRVTVATGADEITVNRPPPWQLDLENEEAVTEYCENAFGFRPLDVFRVSVLDGGVEGLVFIRPARSDEWGGSHRLYASRMFVGERVYGLVPDWATFISACLNTTGLRLTASRESVHHDETLHTTCEQIGAAVRQRLAHLLRSDPVRFEAIMAVHDTDIRGLAVKDADFFEVIIDLLEFDSSLDRIRFGIFRREHETMLVARTTDQFRRVEPIARARGLRIFNGGYTFHEELLARAAQRHPDLELKTFDAADLVDVLEAPVDQGTFDALLVAATDVQTRRGFETVVRDFEPESVPAFFAMGLDTEYHRQLDRTKSRCSGLWREVLDAMAPRADSVIPPRLCLNARCPLVRRIAAIADPTLQVIAVDMLYVQALLSGQYAFTGAELTSLCDGMAELLERAAGAGRGDGGAGQGRTK